MKTDWMCLKGGLFLNVCDVGLFLTRLLRLLRHHVFSLKMMTEKSAMYVSFQDFKLPKSAILSNGASVTVKQKARK